jgi:hypothetical protein
LGYFNLHGLVDAIEWFGQRDPMMPSEGPDYPIALRPLDIHPSRGPQSGKGVPLVVFSEACYGLHIQGRSLEEAISLKFLEAGSLTVVGSTCMAYGSIGTPLIAADLLGRTFWRLIRGGMTAGEALRQAKIHLASLMHRRQGFLDGEDQKTLISFILYGDPLAQPIPNGRLPKSARYLVKPLAELKTVCDRVDDVGEMPPIPAQVMVSVKQVVAQYLPGMTDAQLTLTQEWEQNKEEAPIPSTGHPRDKSSVEVEIHAGGEARPEDEHTHRLVMLSKHVARAEGVHSHYARLTLDERGNLVKLVVSR